MDSYIGRIKAAMAAELDPDVHSELKAKLGCYQVRAGRMNEARDSLSELRSSGAFVRNPRVAIRGMLLESLAAFFGSLDPRGDDRALRAYALASAGKYLDLADLTSAWLAHYHFNRDEIAECVRRLTSVLDHRVRDPEAHLRALLVFADMNMYCGRLARARDVYDQARRVAVDLLDQASIAAMLYNKAALGMNWIRVSKAAAVEVDCESAVAFLHSEIDSAKAYHIGAQQTSLSQLLDWMVARRELERGQYASAKDMYRKLVEAGLSHSTASEALAVRIEYAECLLGLAEVTEAVAVISSIETDGVARLSFDDVLILDSLKRKAIEAMGSGSPFAQEPPDSIAATQQFSAWLVRLRGAADRVEAAMAMGQGGAA